MGTKLDVKVNCTCCCDGKPHGWAVLDNCQFVLRGGDMCILAKGVKLLNGSLIAVGDCASLCICNNSCKQEESECTRPNA